MLTDLRMSDQWERLNREVSSRILGSDSRDELRVYRGVESAIWEVTQGAAKLFPHRRKVIHFQHQDPLHVGSLNQLLRDGFDVINLPLADLENSSQQEKLIDLDTLLVLYSVDDSLLGRVFPTGSIAALCESKKAFAIQVSHHQHRLSQSDASPPSVSAYSILVKSYRHDLAVAHLGAKARLGSTMTALLSWDGVDLSPLWNPGRPPSSQEIEAIRKFEDSGIGGAKVLLDSSVVRLWDRAGVFWDDLDGHAVAHYLAKELKFQLDAPGIESRLETASLSRWGGLRTMDWLKHQGLSAAQIRGSLVVHTSLLNKGFADLVAKVVARVRGLQGF